MIWRRWLVGFLTVRRKSRPTTIPLSYSSPEPKFQQKCAGRAEAFLSPAKLLALSFERGL
jgi:hypothetical protein